MTATPWWAEGIRFECQGTGRCCVARRGYGWVYLTLDDRRRLARHFGLRTSTFTRRHCQQTDGQWHLRGFIERCPFLEGARCGVYAARPAQCRTWPFWPENMSARVWDREIAPYCAGVGKGRRWSAEEIVVQLRRDPVDPWPA